MAPTQKPTKRTKQHSLNTPFAQASKKPNESVQSDLFKMRRTFIRTFTAIDLLITEKFGISIIEAVNNLDTPSKEKLQSNKINDLFTQMDTDIGAIIQPRISVTVNPLAQKKTSEAMVMANQKVTDLTLENLKLTAKVLALEQKNMAREQEENDLLSTTMPTDE